ncbi:uncharacterized protein [Atheta coriaria]|uniref:uncharacterized protein n=1 Tax=Dalotia coriaria TaxID=877792 RepID=UPI0031F3C89F
MFSKPRNLKHLAKLYRYLLLITLVSIILLSYYTINQKLPIITSKSKNAHIFNTPGCSIPNLSITNAKIRKLIYDMPPIVCNEGVGPLFQSDFISIHLLHDALSTYNVTSDNLDCCYQYFKRRCPNNDEKDTQIDFEECVQFTNDFLIDKNKDFVKIECRSRDDTTQMIYEDYFASISLKPIENQDNDYTTNEDQLNVLILGIDAVSRMNLHRQMPKTVEYLQELQAVEMLGYNKIGDNSFPNLIVMLSGHNETELNNACRPTDDSFYDDCEFIWDKFKSNGYITAFGEDTANIGLFTYERRGFHEQPTDYYYNHFDFIAENNVGNTKFSGINQCIGSRARYEVLLDYVSNYAITMNENKRKHFGYFWTTSLTHDYLNMAKLGDDSYRNWLSGLELNDTALILMSDHGMRFGEFRNTYQGVLEDRLPFLFVVLPEWYRKKHSEAYNNLKINRERLITLYDVHQTLLHLSDVKNYQKTNKNSLGISLFEEISNKRTCDDAGIDPHWCTCKESNALSPDHPEIIKVVNFTLNEHINALLKQYDECYNLLLNVILDGRHFVSNSNVNYEDYTVTFRTIPGGGIFEATVRKYNDSNEYNLLGTISRLNLYGNQSKCVHDVYAKLFCYCKK